MSQLHCVSFSPPINLLQICVISLQSSLLLCCEWNNYYGKFSVPTSSETTETKIIYPIKSSRLCLNTHTYLYLKIGLELRLKIYIFFLKALIRKISTYVFSINVKFLSSANVLSSFFLTQTETSRNFQFSHWSYKIACFSFQ